MNKHLEHEVGINGIYQQMNVVAMKQMFFLLQC